MPVRSLTSWPSREATTGKNCARARRILLGQHAISEILPLAQNPDTQAASPLRACRRRHGASRSRGYGVDGKLTEIWRRDERLIRRPRRLAVDCACRCRRTTSDTRPCGCVGADHAASDLMAKERCPRADLVDTARRGPNGGLMPVEPRFAVSFCRVSACCAASRSMRACARRGPLEVDPCLAARSATSQLLLGSPERLFGAVKFQTGDEALSQHGLHVFEGDTRALHFTGRLPSAASTSASATRPFPSS